MRKALNSNNGTGKSMPPKRPFVKIYFLQKGLSEKEASTFYEYFKKRNWTTKTGIAVINWKALANEWIWYYQQEKKPKY